ncbi:hypothetical protein [Lysinibacillus sp. NPDC096212]|uniref:CdiA C-terminal domain-containing protein n=1 Tax=Lysinibacillus sp. NPDC096212 TaxID=3364135 RepID=UPI0038144C39
MLHSTKLLNKILITLMALLLLFNTNYGAFKTSEAHANVLTATFEEWAAASYAGVVMGTMALATGAMHTEEYLLDNVDAMYQTAKESWKTMAPDMKANFLSSLDQMADGIVTVGDWITGALDALKPKFGDNTGTGIGGVNYISKSSGGNAILTVENATINSLLLTYIDSDNFHNHAFSSFSIAILTGKWDNTVYAKIYVDGYTRGTIDFGELSNASYATLVQKAGNVKTPADMISLGATIGIGSKIRMEYRDGTVVTPGASTYNRLDEWIRERAIPNGQLGVYNPGAQAYTPDGYRLGLSTDGQTLLKLPDGIPWEGTADWKQPLLNTVDGTTAVLDTAVGSWIDVATGKKIRDATVPEIVSGTGVDESTAEYVLIRAKDEEKAREDIDKPGKFIGNLNELTPDERKVVNELVAEGKIVEQIPRSTVPGEKTPDFKVDGVLTELKTLKNPNVNTGVGRIKDAFKQNAEAVIIDAREAGLTREQAQEILTRAKGTYPDKQLPGKVEIWIKEIVTN